MTMTRRLQLRHVGKAVLSCIVAVNLLCFATLYSLHSAPQARPELLPWSQPPRDRANALPQLQYTFDTPCKEITRPPLLSKAADDWKTVVPNGTFVYSAYYDNRTPRASVVILGMSRGEGPPGKWCQIWYPHHLELVPARYDIVPETHDKKYAPSFHTCPVDVRDPPPYAVSLVVDKCDVTSSYLHLHIAVKNSHQTAAPLGPPVNHPPKHHGGKRWQNENQPFDSDTGAHQDMYSILDQTFKYNYTVCLTPFNFQYKDTHQLVEMIEVNRMFGANHFVFYDYDSAPDIHPYLKYYSKQGIVDTLPWRLPVKVNVWPPVQGHTPEVHYFAQIVALNDCVYRSMSNSKYVVLTDLDEIIVPQTETTWDKMLSRVAHSPDIGAWMFQNTFFRMDWSDSTLVDPLAKLYQLRTMLKTKREPQIFPPYSRSKLILRPQLITMTGIHFVYKHLHSHIKTCNVEPHKGLLHHYRIGFGAATGEEEQMEARIMLQYQSVIINRVKQTFQAVVQHL